MGQKGQVHLEFGQPFHWPEDAPDVKPERQLSQAFDRELLQGMKVWPNQILAAEALGVAVPLHAEGVKPTEEDRSQWLQRRASIEDALVEKGWSREQAAQRWCQTLMAPLAHRASLLDD